MSPLPERRKTAEELAELRESLGIPADPAGAKPPQDRTRPAADDSGIASEPEPGIPAKSPRPRRPSAPGKPEAGETPESAESAGEGAGTPAVPEVTRVRPGRASHSLRKSERLVVDQPKGRTARDDGGVPPVRRQGEELPERRMADGPPEPTAVVASRLASTRTLLSCYGIGILGLGLGGLGVVVSRVEPINLPFGFLRLWAVSETFMTGLFAVFAVTAGLMLLAAGWLAVFRPLSRHHAGFLTILALLTLVFSALFCFF